MSLFSFLCSSNTSGDLTRKPRRRAKHSLDSDLESIISPIISPITAPLISAPIPYKYCPGEPVANSIRESNTVTDARCRSWSWQEQSRGKDKHTIDKGFSKSLHSQRNNEFSESYQEAKKALLSSTPDNPASLRMTVVKDFQATGPDNISVRRGQRVRVLYKLGDWLWAELKGGEGGYIPYSHCRLSKKHYCTPIHVPDKNEAIVSQRQSSTRFAFTQSLTEERRYHGRQTGSFLTRTSSPKRSIDQSISLPRNGIVPPELFKVRDHKTLLGAKLKEYTITPDNTQIPLIGPEYSKQEIKRRPSLFSGYKHTHHATGRKST
ncbi:hypothetical protein LOD99_10120 [Oopsacas minuta]|uniref:SH3 domain-containing protein n=1 Tax=Oopsacas minuta TaxID=111878 RepID=A0AAV7KJZ6_9METZ|nr:hypothetical protein LOD99_10120 [Oopsacas minuta]